MSEPTQGAAPVPPAFPAPEYLRPSGRTGARQHAPATAVAGAAAAGRPAAGSVPGWRPNRATWAVIAALAVGVVVLLVRSGHVGTTELIIVLALVPSIILHEVAHGYAAYALGDDTAKRAGRLSLNPLRHVDPVGTVLVPILTVWGGWGFFGWAKPVPVNLGRLRRPRDHGLLVALAGPALNVVLSALLGLAFYLAFAAGRVGPVPATLPARIVFQAGMLNLWVALFNMIPLPPLDGSALVERLLPAAWWPGYLRVRSRGLFVLLAAVLLLSWAHVYPLSWIFTRVENWWGHLVHAW